MIGWHNPDVALDPKYAPIAAHPAPPEGLPHSAVPVLYIVKLSTADAHGPGRE
jgi:hypothetical protein